MATPPPAQCGERLDPWRARPVPFWRHGFAPPPDTSARLLVAWVPERAAASWAVTTWCMTGTLGWIPKIAAGRSCRPIMAPDAARTSTASAPTGPVPAGSGSAGSGRAASRPVRGASVTAVSRSSGPRCGRRSARGRARLRLLRRAVLHCSEGEPRGRVAAAPGPVDLHDLAGPGPHPGQRAGTVLLVPDMSHADRLPGDASPMHGAVFTGFAAVDSL